MILLLLMGVFQDQIFIDLYIWMRNAWEIILSHYRGVLEASTKGDSMIFIAVLITLPFHMLMGKGCQLSTKKHTIRSNRIKRIKAWRYRLERMRR